MKNPTWLARQRKIRFKLGFSMIELSVVILIIGVLIGGILASQRIIAKFRITTAQTLTISSPVNGIPDSTIWLESSLEKSFKDSESSDTNALSAWYDIRESVNKNNAVQTNSANAPTYSNTINYIHAVKFDGTNGYLTIPDASFLNNSSYTIFVLEKRESNKSNNYFIGDSTSGNESTTNKNLTLGYSADGTIKHSQSSDNSYTSSITTYAASSDKPRIFAFVHDKTSGKKTYINGLLAATSSNTENLTGITSLRIGSGYQGQIGEIIMFGRAITTEERQSVEDYLGKKWTSPILRTVGNSALGASCTGGTVSNTGCQLTCTVPTTLGITTTSVSDGTGTLSCDTSNHFGSASLAYSCSNGAFAFTGSQSSCSCGLGFSPSGSTCVATYCSFSGTTGIADGTQVAVGTGTQACDSGAIGSVNYTCTSSGGAPTINSGSCYVQCSGGTKTTATISGTFYTIHTFTASGTLTCPSSKTGNLLIVAGGGGGGGSSGGGGGGAGGVLQQSSATISAGDNIITVGIGGAGGHSTWGGSWPNRGANGGNSSFGSTIATGGGGGGGGGVNSQCGSTGSTGGSGGGGGRTNSASGCSGPILGGVGIAGQGNNGGKSAPNYYSGGGGGGAGASGTDGTSSVGGTGGVGVSSTILDGTTAVYYGGGGAGAGGDGAANGSGGTGGGGAANGVGTANKGGGGGGGVGGVGGTGGSGVVIVRYSN